MTRADFAQQPTAMRRRSVGTQKQPFRVLGTVLIFTLFCLSAGCHSSFVQVTVVNATGQTIRLLEVDYPSASFGTQDLATGANFHYRFKVIGQGPTKLIWTDARQREHTVQGPALHEGQEGDLRIRIDPATAGPATADWHLDLHER